MPSPPPLNDCKCGAEGVCTFCPPAAGEGELEARNPAPLHARSTALDRPGALMACAEGTRVVPATPRHRV